MQSDVVERNGVGHSLIHPQFPTPVKTADNRFFIPWSASFSAISLPIPRDAPVTMAIWTFNIFFSLHDENASTVVSSNITFLESFSLFYLLTP